MPVPAPLSSASSHSWKRQLQPLTPDWGSFNGSISSPGTFNISMDTADELVRHRCAAAIHRV